MKRRSFLKGTLPMALAPLALNGIPIRAMAKNLMTSSFDCSEIGDRILVMVQLHGGNDGLNTLVPVNQYGTYKTLRPLIGIEDTGPRKYINLDNTLPLQDQVGLHPDLVGIKNLYDQGMVNWVMDVSYTNNNGSHFKGTDIWLTGKDGDTIPERPDSGWWGRYLDHRFPNYPDAYPNPDMPDPLGLEFGSHIISLGFHRQMGIPTGLTISNDPDNLNALLATVGGAMPTTFPNSDYGNELKYLVEMEQSTNVFAQRLEDVYNAGANTPGVIYPEHYHTWTTYQYDNRLSPQLKTVARLLSGGCKTKIFLTRMGGFDTHEGQAIAGKPSYGSHGSLLYHLSSAIEAFMEDIKGLGLEDRVMLMTFSEFGRQVGENGTYGTDHGTSAPMLLVGKGIKPGITGTNPNLSVIQRNNFVGYQHDYRQVLATILQDWFGANYGTMDEVELYDWTNQKLDLIDSAHNDGGNIIDFVADQSCDPTTDIDPPDPNNPTEIDDDIRAKTEFKLWPNPAQHEIHISLKSDQLQPASIGIMSMDGKLVKSKEVRLYVGTFSDTIDISDLPRGVYMIEVIANRRSTVGAVRLAGHKFVVQ
ncbi:MAG: DUF1501 domain-containing protein [Bacteroidetes bacterium]|nr:DUF1501 domain-containing protein [Bacteroidota bacterium]